MEKEVITYHTQDGKEPFIDWLRSLRDMKVRQRIEARLKRIKYGNYGDHKHFEGIIELRLHFGKGYRIYFGEEHGHLIILLAGGDKSSQKTDIDRAIEYWRDYHEQKKI
jgi:putative addiction module killer protein